MKHVRITQAFLDDTQTPHEGQMFIKRNKLLGFPFYMYDSIDGDFNHMFKWMGKHVQWYRSGNKDDYPTLRNEVVLTHDPVTGVVLTEFRTEFDILVEFEYDSDLEEVRRTTRDVSLGNNIVLMDELILRDDRGNVESVDTASNGTHSVKSWTYSYYDGGQLKHAYDGNGDIILTLPSFKKI